MLYEISDSTKNNILIFFDRLTIQGFKEIQALNEITHILSNPIQETPKGEQSYVGD